MLGTVKPVYLGAAALVVAALLYVKFKGAAGVGTSLGSGAIDLVDGAIAGAVVSTGQLIGIPATSETECEKAMREGRTWDASFTCPAGTFLKYLGS
jgi:hypothetical protein